MQPRSQYPGWPVGYPYWTPHHQSCGRAGSWTPAQTTELKQLLPTSLTLWFMSCSFPLRNSGQRAPVFMPGTLSPSWFLFWFFLQEIDECVTCLKPWFQHFPTLISQVACISPLPWPIWPLWLPPLLHEARRMLSWQVHAFSMPSNPLVVFLRHSSFFLFPTSPSC